MKEYRILSAGSTGFHDEMKEMLSPLGAIVVNAFSIREIRKHCLDGRTKMVLLDEDSYKPAPGSKLIKIMDSLNRKGVRCVIISSRESFSAILEYRKKGAKDYIKRPYNSREFISRFNAVLQKKRRITCIGGGTGLFHMLSGLKKLSRTLLFSVVSMSDDGGSSGKLRASFGILPPGDIRRSLVALSNAPETMNELMQYRFKKGEGISGHNVGNLLITALKEIKGTLREAVRATSDILNVRGVVLPITETQTTLCAECSDGMVVKGESAIDSSEERNPDLRVEAIWHEPRIKCTVEAYCGIIFTDMLIIGPGDLFTSIITNFLVKGITRAIRETGAKKVYICNLMTKPGETPGFTATDHVKEIIKYMGGDYLDHIVISDTVLSKKARREYALKGQHAVRPGNVCGLKRLTGAKVILADVGHRTELVRHDSEKLRKVIDGII